MMHIRPRFLAAAATTLTLSVALLRWGAAPLVAPVAAAGQQRPGVSSFNSGQARPAEDPAAVAKGKTLYGINCQACHGADLRGGDMGGPNLLRSQVALSDQRGELITPIIHGARQAQGMPNIGLNDEDALAVAAYVRSVISTIGGQGMPPGQAKPLNIVVGDAARGNTYFAAHCATCHSADKDLKGVATKYSEPKLLQARWIAGGRISNWPSSQSTATVTLAPGKSLDGSLVHIDDFLVTLKLDDGTERSIRRNGDIPKVIVKDPLQAHRDLLPKYTDSDIHDVTAYLVTLK
jgi:cytochrome c oxidase cbb3-type subunit 3